MTDSLLEELQTVTGFHQTVRRELGRVIVGQEAVIDHVLIALLARGHCLLLGVPGLAKTLLVRSLGEILDLGFNRIQFTPDLMPSDITGTEILDEEVGSSRRTLRFVQGPVFTHILLADEINRTPPKTQAALLEAMQESVVTTGGRTFPLPQPFFVLATQNPIEQEGTYPLPEAQLDRFMFLVRMGYPARDEEVRILRQTTANRDEKPARLIDAATILRLQRVVRDIPVSEHVLGYCIDLVRKTRPQSPDAPDFVRENLSYGAGPRAGQYLVLAAKAWAALQGRANVSCADVRRHAHAVLSHRIACNFHAAGEGVDAVQIIDRLLALVPEPDSEGA